MEKHVSSKWLPHDKTFLAITFGIFPSKYHYLKSFEIIRANEHMAKCLQSHCKKQNKHTYKRKITATLSMILLLKITTF